MPALGQNLDGPVLRPRPPRLPLVWRNQCARTAARQRAMAHTRTPLTPAQRLRQPPARRSRAARLAQAVGAVLGSAAAHAAIVGIGIAVAALELRPQQSAHQRVSIEVHERVRAKPPPPPPPPREQSEPALRPERTAPPPAPPRQQEEPPPEAAKGPPLRVVGISLESTVEGGGGPAFLVGQTRMGLAATQAEVPRRAAPKPRATAARAAAPEPPSPNRAASRIPTAKTKYTLPKRRRPRVPAYPAELRSQGIEADVTVVVSLDAQGKVTSVKIISASPYPAFNQAARVAALGEEFEPALRNGVPVAYTLSYTYRFRIED